MRIIGALMFLLSVAAFGCGGEQFNLCVSQADYEQGLYEQTYDETGAPEKPKICEDNRAGAANFNANDLNNCCP